MTVEKRRALGRGLDGLLPAAPMVSQAGGSYGTGSVFSCPIEAIRPNPEQPRRHMDSARLDELAQSMLEQGLIEPLVVRRTSPGSTTFEIVAGERRWRAAQRAGIKELLVVVKDVSPNAAFELALIENLQREDLGPIEVAEALDRLIREHQYTQEHLAQRIGKDRTTVANTLRLLKLPKRVRMMVIEGKLSEGHARALLGATDIDNMEWLAEKASRGKLSVRKVEQMVREERTSKTPGSNAATTGATTKSPNVRDVEERLRRRLGLRVQVTDQRGRGQVVIHYASLDEFDRLLETLGMA